MNEKRGWRLEARAPDEDRSSERDGRRRKRVLADEDYGRRADLEEEAAIGESEQGSETWSTPTGRRGKLLSATDGGSVPLLAKAVVEARRLGFFLVESSPRF